MVARVGEITPGWRIVHIGFEGDDVDVHGVDPWSVTPWERGATVITVAHPSYPAERHQMCVYHVKSADGVRVEFAAGEFSNGVWGFFVRGPV